MKVLIIGVTGFIGLPTAQALVRAGHIVYGLVRTAGKIQKLAAEEVIPVVGDVYEPAKWLTQELIRSLDVIIQMVGGTAAADLQHISTLLLDSFAEASNNFRPSSAPKLTFLLTAGTWGYGDDRKAIVNDTTPMTNPPEMVAWGVEHEQRVLNHAVLNGLTVRPGLVYGRSGSLFGPLFRTALEGKVRWPGTPGGRLSTVHVDDLANLFVLAAEKAQLIGGKSFVATNDFSESVDDILRQLAEVSGAKGYEYHEPTNPCDHALTVTTIVRPYLARALLGWQPRKAGMVDHMEIYYSAWKAHEDL